MPNTAELKKALKQSARLIDDLLAALIAPEHCHHLTVAIAKKRIGARGGRLAYIGDVQEDNRKALGIKRETNGQRLARNQRRRDRKAAKTSVPETIVSDLLCGQPTPAPRTRGEMPIDPRDMD